MPHDVYLAPRVESAALECVPARRQKICPDSGFTRDSFAGVFNRRRRPALHTMVTGKVGGLVSALNRQGKHTYGWLIMASWRDSQMQGLHRHSIPLTPQATAGCPGRRLTPRETEPLAGSRTVIR